MRKIKFKKFIPHEYESLENGGKKVKDGTGCFSDYIYDGLFHVWGMEILDGGDSGIGSYTVGIVEMPDGIVETVLPIHIRFLSEE